MRRVLLIPLAAAVLSALAPATAPAAPPANDHYLSSLTVNRPDGSLPRDFRDAVDTTEATTQADTFDPNRDGVAFGGGSPEPTSCPGGVRFGRTVWYDIAPPTAGGLELVAAGADPVVAVYEWSRETSQLGRLVTCRNESPGPTEEVLLQGELRGGRSYTVQVGGVDGAGGPLDLRVRWFPDRDGDGILDEQPDECRDLRGIEAFGGCPPVARGTVSVTYDRQGASVRITRLAVNGVAAAARVRVACRRCGRAVSRTARRAGTLRVGGFEGRVLRAGDTMELRLTQPRTRTGRYRFGAIGRVLRWPVRATGLGPRTERCLRPGSDRRRLACP